METTVAAAAGAGGAVAEDGLSLGLLPQKLARTGTYPFRMINPFPSSSSSSSSHVDPTFWDSSSKLCDFYDVAAATSLQPFPVSQLRNPGGGMVASPRYPFTWEQWKMLERQALIYKHMVASVPVPTELLIPIISSTRKTLAGVSASHLGRCSSFNLRFSNGTDPEPGRCRRTDGKKWRCSRDAAPDQKYCERHMHRGRPRSRKPVEVPAQDITSPTAANPNAALSKALHRTPGLPSQAILPKEQRPRCLDPATAAITGSSNGSSNFLFLQPYEDNLSLNFVDFENGVSKTDQENDQSCLYLKYDFADPETEQRQPARRFIDTWSKTSAENQTTISANNNEPSMSSLTLSIPGERTNETQVGADSSGSKRDSSWINLPPWLSSPLGEVLQQSGSNSASSPSRLESSPSCVLQKTLASLSDSSGSSSPTFAAAAAVAKSEIALQWLMP